MRVFFGLELDPTTAMHVADWRDRQLSPVGTPVPLANFHITLAFLGALENPALERLCLSVDDWLAGRATCGATLQLDRTGYLQTPGIYWLGPTDWPAHLTQLAQKLNSLGGAVGAKRDRNPFLPHISLFRRCAVAPPAPAYPPAIAMAYERVTLFESRRGKRSSSYHVVQDWQLQCAAD